MPYKGVRSVTAVDSNFDAFGLERQGNKPVVVAETGTGGPLSVYFGDTPSIDAFDRLRVSLPTTVWDFQTEYNKNPYTWVENFVTGGSSAHAPATSSVNLTCTTAASAKATRQTKAYMRYQPGKSQLILMTFVLATGKANLVQRVGYFDDNNGIFFQYSNVTPQFVRRTKTSGSVVNNPVDQGDWNLDPLDGSGPSGITLDFTKSQIFVADLEWLGVGRVRVGFVIDGIIVYAHEMLHANVLTLPYMSTANLPMRFEIENADVTGSESTLKTICASCMSEGGMTLEDMPGLTWSAGNGVTLRAVASGTATPVLSIRCNPTINSVTNRGLIFPETCSLFAQTRAVHWTLQHNPTLSSLANFTNVSTNNSLTGYDTHATTTLSTPGRIVASGYLEAGRGVDAGLRTALNTYVPLTNSFDGTTGDIMTVTMAGIGGTAEGAATFGWKEVF